MQSCGLCVDMCVFVTLFLFSFNSLFVAWQSVISHTFTSTPLRHGWALVRRGTKRVDCRIYIRIWLVVALLFLLHALNSLLLFARQPAQSSSRHFERRHYSRLIDSSRPSDRPVSCSALHSIQLPFRTTITPWRMALARHSWHCFAFYPSCGRFVRPFFFLLILLTPSCRYFSLPTSSPSALTLALAFTRHCHSTVWHFTHFSAALIVKCCQILFVYLFIASAISSTSLSTHCNLLQFNWYVCIVVCADFNLKLTRSPLATCHTCKIRNFSALPLLCRAFSHWLL